TRAVTGQGREVRGRYDFLPFGEEVYVGRMGYGGSVSQKFTGHERDIETNLDFAQARYFSSSLGRFTSSDPALVSASIENPQTWNRYVYVLNNPLKYSDPLGLWAIDRNYTVITTTEN